MKSQKPTPIIIGITGPSSSGKTSISSTISKYLQDSLNEAVPVISQDDYYKHLPHLSYKERSMVNFDHPDAFDMDLLVNHLNQLKQWNTVDGPVYDMVDSLRKMDENKRIEPHEIIIVEGILLLCNEELRNVLDIIIYIDTPLDICLTRRIHRDTKEFKRDLYNILEQYETNVRPMFYKYIDQMRDYADLVVPRGGHNHVAIDFINARIKELLAKARNNSN